MSKFCFSTQSCSSHTQLRQVRKGCHTLLPCIALLDWGSLRRATGPCTLIRTIVICVSNAASLGPLGVREVSASRVAHLHTEFNPLQLLMVQLILSLGYNLPDRAPRHIRRRHRCCTARYPPGSLSHPNITELKLFSPDTKKTC
jgi:hypothetical protein